MANTSDLHLADKNIYLLRGRKVMLSFYLARLYKVEPKVLMQSVKRNLERFPDDFMFQLTITELDSLRSHFVTLEGHGKGQHIKYLPYAFTQEGVAMLSSILKSKHAIHANIAIMRTFVKLRELMHEHSDLADKINMLEKRYDSNFKVVFNSIRELIKSNSEDPSNLKIKKCKIGFRLDK